MKSKSKVLKKKKFTRPNIKKLHLSISIVQVLKKKKEVERLHHEDMTNIKTGHIYKNIENSKEERSLYMGSKT